MKNSITHKTQVLHIISGDLWAGAEVMAFNLIRSLGSCPGLDITVILLNEGRLAQELRNCGLTVHIIDEKQISFWNIIRKAVALITDSPPDIIHAHRYKENLIAFLISIRFRRTKLIATQHGLPEISSSNASLVTRFKSKVNFNILARYFDKTVAVSNDIRKALINSFDFADGRVDVIHNGIQRPPATAAIREDGKPFTIGSSGRLFSVKDFPLMVEIARAVADNDSDNIMFELAGEGPERPRLEDLIQRYKLQQCFVLRGHQDNMDSFYRGLDVYLSTSVHEGIPMTILEAMAHGLPVVAPAVGGIPEIFKDTSEGFLIADRDPQSFAARCLQLREDHELRRRMSGAAKKRVEEAFSAEMMAESYYKAYLRTLESKTSCF